MTDTTTPAEVLALRSEVARLSQAVTYDEIDRALASVPAEEVPGAQWVANPLFIAKLVRHILHHRASAPAPAVDVRTAALALLTAENMPAVYSACDSRVQGHKFSAVLRRLAEKGDAA